MPIEPFAIWNLIKSALDATQTPSPTPPQSPAGGEEKPILPEGESAEQAEEIPDSSAAARACENYLLRHEQQAGKRKKN